jgi:hypothetical protein
LGGLPAWVPKIIQSNQNPQSPFYVVTKSWHANMAFY